MKARTKKRGGVLLSRERVKWEVYKATKNACVGSQNGGWVLFLSAVVEEGQYSDGAMVDSLFKEILAMANSKNKAHDMSSLLNRKKRVIGFYLPHEHIYTENIKTQQDLDVTVRKIQRNSLYSTVGIMCAGLLNIDGYTHERVRRVFKIADLIDAEVISGRNSIEALERGLLDVGVNVVCEFKGVETA